MQDDLPTTARRIAAFLEAHARDVVHMSITEVADRTESSEGSVVGLCQRFGAAGFQQLKILLAQELVEPVRLIQEDLQPGDSFETVAQRVFAAHTASLADTLKVLTPEILNSAVKIIRSAGRVEVYGIGSSTPVAQDLNYRLVQLGIESKALVDPHVQAVSASMAGPGVAVVTISHSGSTVDTVVATKMARESGAATIGITRLGRSPLERHCDVVLHTVAKETRYRPEAMSSRLAQLALIDSLVSCCALSDPRRSLANMQKSLQVISEKRY